MILGIPSLTGVAAGTIGVEVGGNGITEVTVATVTTAVVVVTDTGEYKEQAGSVIVIDFK